MGWGEKQETKDIPYVRGIWIDVLVYHQRREDSGCHCGWANLGHSWAVHLVDVYEMSIQNID